MTYVSGFVAAVPNANRERYLADAIVAAEVFKEFGAIRVVECWGHYVPDGVLTSFPLAVKAEPDESVVFSWIEWPSVEVAKESMEKAMHDPRMKPMQGDMPFDGKRMIWGGFEMILDR